MSDYDDIRFRVDDYHDGHNNGENRVTRRGRPNKKGTRLRLIALLTLVFLASSYLGYAAMACFLGDRPNIELPAPLLPGANNKINILLMGVDQRKNEPSRSDTIILASVDLKTQEVHLLSIPRDTRVAIPNHGVQKINHAHALGGPALLIKTVENFLGLPVNYYVETNFAGFKNCIDLLGGVTINVEKRMYYPWEEIDLRPGVQKLNGHDALAYVRFRSDQQGDIGRIQRQQKFFQALAKEALSLKAVWKAPWLIGELKKNVQTNMPTKEMLRVAFALKGMDQSRLQAHTLPGDPATIDGLSYWVPRAGEVKQMVALMKN